MENPTPEQLDTLLAELKRRPQAVDRFDSLLAAGLTISKKSVPKPIKQFRFAEAKTAHRLSTIFLEVAAGLFALLLVVGFAAASSAPGQKLYTIKRAAEEARLDLIRDPAQQANKRLSLIEKRIQETEVILESTGNDEQKAAALNELAAQTKSAVDTVREATGEQNGTTTNPELLASLTKIAEKQEALLQNLNNKTEEVGAEVAPETKVAAEEVRSILATVNNHALATIGESTKAIKGKISRIGKASLTIDGKEIIFIADTKVLLPDGETEAPLTILKTNMEVNVSAKINRDNLEALSILLEKEPIADAPTTPENPTTIPTNTEQRPTNESTSPEELIEEQNTGRAGFIYEDPAPAYVP